MIWDLKKYKDNIALITDENTISYGQLDGFSEEFSRHLEERSLVFLLCRNAYESVLGYVGCLNHGMIPVMIDSNLDEALLAGLTEKYSPRYFWLPDIMTNKCQSGEKVYSSGEYSLLKTEYEQNVDIYDELALLMTTSGSTGSPKLVRLSYKNIIANTKSIVDYLAIDEKERTVTNLPMHYVYGLSIINTHLYAGASIVLTEKSLFQKDFWDMIKEEKVTNFGGVPYTYEMLNRLRFFKMDLPALKTITQAGGKLAPELHQKFAEYAIKNDKKFVVMYGAAEATARMGYLPAADSLRKCGSMGIPIPGGSFSLVDDHGEKISTPHTVGELVYQGDNVMLGYAECAEDLTKGDDEHGLLKTGDLASFDEDGYYTIVGRKKRFLKIYGKRVNLQEVEHILQKHFDTLGIAVSGKDDQLHVFVENANNVEDIKEYIAQKFNVHHLAIKMHCVDGIPKNTAGKTLYSKLEMMI